MYSTLERNITYISRFSQIYLQGLQENYESWRGYCVSRCTESMSLRLHCFALKYWGKAGKGYTFRSGGLAWRSLVSKNSHQFGGNVKNSFHSVRLTSINLRIYNFHPLIHFSSSAQVGQEKKGCKLIHKIIFAVIVAPSKHVRVKEVEQRKHIFDAFF